MKFIATGMVLILHLFILRPEVSAQWEKMNSPQGGRVAATLICGENILAATSGGLFRSGIHGADWKKVSDREIISFALSGKSIFATNYTTQENVIVSTDMGESWRVVGKGGIDYSVLYIAVQGNYIFSATEGGGGIYRISDFDSSWIKVNNGLPVSYGLAESITSLAAGEKYLFAGSWRNMWRSEDHGASWQNVSYSFSDFVTSIAVEDSLVIAGTSTGRIYFSTNNGQSWTSAFINNTARVKSIAISGGKIFAGTDNEEYPADSEVGVFLSTDSAQTWHEINNGLINNKIWSVSALGPDVFIGSNASGVFHSTDDGRNWSEFNNGLNAVFVEAFGKCGDNLFAGTFSNGMYLSKDNGRNWTRVMDIPAAAWVREFAVKDSTVYAALGNKIYVSTDQGLRWKIMPSFPKTEYAIRTIAVDGTNILAGILQNKVYLSTDSGESWRSICNEVPSEFSSDVTKFAIKDSAIFMGSSYNGMMISTNYGAVWKKANIGERYVYTFALKDNNVFAGTGNGVYVSSDGGQSWESKSTGLIHPTGGTAWIRTLVRNDSCLFAGGLYSGVFLSKDNAQTWEAVNDGLVRGEDCRALIISGDYIILGGGSFYRGGGGIYRRPLSEMLVTGVKDYNASEMEYNLDQNYPNPFNPATTVNYNMPYSGYVELKVYDMLGKEVMNVFSGEKPAGIHKALVNAGNLPSGIYVCRIRVLSEKMSFEKSIKMILLK